MAVQICNDCGEVKNEHELRQEKTKLQYNMARLAIQAISDETKCAALEKTLVEWRTHALPSCDPLAIT